MRIAATILGIVLLFFGRVWTLQGANILTGSAVMSGHSLWMWIGIAAAIVGILVLAPPRVRPRAANRLRHRILCDNGSPLGTAG